MIYLSLGSADPSVLCSLSAGRWYNKSRPKERPLELKILTWNIHKAIGGLDRRYSLARVSEVIHRAAPDIALLQEVADDWPKAGGEKQGESLTRLTHLPYLRFAPEHRFREGGYGNAILSRFPLEGPTRVDLKIGWRKQRSALGAHVLLPSSESGAPPTRLHVYSLHLGLAESERRRQMKRLLETEHLNLEDEPCVLGGDFNDVFGTLGKNFLQRNGYEQAGARQRTFPAAAPVFCLDGVYVKRLTPLSCEPYRGPGARLASDHLPLLARVRAD